MLAYCGLNCAECRAFKATVNADEATPAKVAAEFGEGRYGPKQWVCLGCTQPETAFLADYCARCSIRACAILGIEILGFFVIGWDGDTAETYRRTLDFCDECNLVPFIFTLRPMPGSVIYREYVQQGRMLPDLTWDQYGGPDIIFRHPLMSEQEMFDCNAEVMREGYSMGRIVKRTLHTLRHRPSLDVTKSSFFTQLGLRDAYRQLYEQARRRRRARLSHAASVAR